MAFDRNRLAFSYLPLGVSSDTVAAVNLCSVTVPSGITTAYVDGMVKALALVGSGSDLALIKLVTLEELGNWPGGNGIMIPSQPALVEFDGGSLKSILKTGTSINLSGNSLLATVRFPNLRTLYGNVDISNCALDAASVNALFATLLLCTNSFAAPWGDDSEVVDVSGDNSADPTGQGLIDKAALIAIGATVYDHSNPP